MTNSELAGDIIVEFWLGIFELAGIFRTTLLSDWKYIDECRRGIELSFLTFDASSRRSTTDNTKRNNSPCSYASVDERQGNTQDQKSSREWHRWRHHHPREKRHRRKMRKWMKRNNLLQQLPKNKRLTPCPRRSIPWIIRKMKVSVAYSNVDKSTLFRTILSQRK